MPGCEHTPFRGYSILLNITHPEKESDHSIWESTVGGVCVNLWSISRIWSSLAYLTEADYTVKKTRRYVAFETRKPATGE